MDESRSENIAASSPDFRSVVARMRQQGDSERVEFIATYGKITPRSNVQPIRDDLGSQACKTRRDYLSGSIVRVGFTERQWAVVDLVAQGYRNAELGPMVGLSEHMVKNYLRAIYDRLGIWNRVELALWYEKLWYELLLRESQCQ